MGIVWHSPVDLLRNSSSSLTDCCSLICAKAGYSAADLGMVMQCAELTHAHWFVKGDCIRQQVQEMTRECSAGPWRASYQNIVIHRPAAPVSRCSREAKLARN